MLSPLHKRGFLFVVMAVAIWAAAGTEASEAGDNIMYRRPWFGARFARRTGVGIRVTHVTPGSPADTAGLARNDIILEFGGQNFYQQNNDPDQLTNAILLAAVDKPVTVVYRHVAERRTVSVQLGEQPFLGVMFSGHEGQGFLVREVIHRAPAGPLGLQSKDLIIAYAGQSFRGTALRSRILAEAIRRSPFNTPLNLTVLRNGQIIRRTIVYKNPRAAGRSDATSEEKPNRTAEVGTVLFSDNFNDENSGRGQANYRRFANWEVVRGDVDLIGTGYFDHQPGNGLYVDLDGTKSAFTSATVAGTLASKNPLVLSPGTYLLQFDLAGHPYEGPNTVIVRLGDVYRADFTLDRQQAGTGFRSYEQTIEVNVQSTGRLVFQHRGGDFAGLLLDNVRLAKLP